METLLFKSSPSSWSHKNQVIVVDYLLLGSVSRDKYYTFSTKRPFKWANIWLFSARRDCLTPCDADWAQASSIIIGGRYSRGGPPPPKNYTHIVYCHLLLLTHRETPLLYHFIPVIFDFFYGSTLDDVLLNKMCNF